MNDDDAFDDDILRWYYGGSPPEGDVDAICSDVDVRSCETSRGHVDAAGCALAVGILTPAWQRGSGRDDAPGGPTFVRALAGRVDIALGAL